MNNNLGTKQDILNCINSVITGINISQANQYISQIEVSNWLIKNKKLNINNIEILIELLFEIDENKNNYLEQIINFIYCLLKKNIMQLFEDENLYHKIKNLIFIKCITEKYLKMQKRK